MTTSSAPSKAARGRARLLKRLTKPRLSQEYFMLSFFANGEFSRIYKSCFGHNFCYFWKKPGGKNQFAI